MEITIPFDVKNMYRAAPAPDGVSIVVPVFNEQDGVANTIEAIHNQLNNIDLSFEIIVVDDGSTDNTPKILRDLQQRYPHLQVLEHETNWGYGAALKTGIAKSAFDKILIIDADQTYPIEEIPKLVRLAGDYDMVVGSRTGPEAQIPMIRRPAKTILTWLAQFLSNRRIPDLNSGFRVFKKEIAQNWIHMIPDGFSFTSTLTIIALHKGYRIHYVPISYHKREGKSKIRPLRDTLNFFQLILRTILYVNPLRIFIPASLFFFAISLFLYVMRVAFGGAFLVTIIITFICGFELLVVGMLADLIDKRLR
jgi:glycosyltransferase involved in cell wall biosynthesis